MSTTRNTSALPILAILLVLNYSCICIAKAKESSNVTYDDRANYYPAVATWYGDPTGAGSGGACGLANDVVQDPYYGMISAGNDRIFKGGKGCGACFNVKCTDNPACSGYPARVTITDQCPGSCNNDPYHFDLSGLAFGALAKPGQANNLRNAGRINVQYQRVKCNYKSNIKLRIDLGSNPYYLAFIVESLKGYGDIGHIEIQPSYPKATWMATQNSYGLTWKFDVPQGTTGPYSVRITGPENTTSVTAYNVIPANWSPGKYYYSSVNF